jgi:hypothetical protein
MMGGGGMMGGQQSVGGGGGGRGGGGRGGGGFGGGGRGGRGGGFNIPPEKILRVDVPLVCLDHGLREPSSSKPYAIRPIENYIQDPAVIEIVTAYANGEVPEGVAQAAVWNLNSRVSWNALAAKLTGTERYAVRNPYFSAGEIKGAMSLVAEAQRLTAGKKVKPRPFKLPGEKSEAQPTKPEDIVSPGEQPLPANKAGEGTAAKSADKDKLAKPKQSSDAQATEDLGKSNSEQPASDEVVS